VALHRPRPADAASREPLLRRDRREERMTADDLNDLSPVASWIHRIAPRRQTAKMRAPGWGGSSYPVQETLWGAG